MVQWRHARWYVMDLGSAPGTLVNGVPIGQHTPTVLAELDLLRIGPWTFRVGMNSTTINRPMAPTRDDAGRSTLRVSSRSIDAAGAHASQRLEQLIDSTLRLMDAPDEGTMARVVLDAALAGTGYSRGAVLRPAAAEQVELIHSAGAYTAEMRDNGFSRTLIREACAGRLASLTDSSPTTAGDRTLGELRIHSAVCAPVMVSGVVVALVYLDARAEETRVRADADSFCAALARMYGMAIGSAMRTDLEARRAALEQDLGAAREAQQLIMPPPDGSFPGLTYSVRSVPGRFVAGDLFDVVDLGGYRTAVTIGDVSGEGAGSAILMASTQAYLHAALRRSTDLAEAVSELNRYVDQHSPMDRFVSLWVGVFDQSARTLTYVDAGHGHWLYVPAGGEPQRRNGGPRGGGIPLGISPEYPYHSAQVAISPGDRVVLYSDGLLEQESPAGEEFGSERIAEVVRACDGPAADADRLLTAVRTHAARPFFDDDTTIASVRVDV